MLFKSSNYYDADNFNYCTSSSAIVEAIAMDRKWELEALKYFKMTLKNSIS